MPVTDKDTVEGLLDQAVDQWRRIDNHIAELTLLRIALGAREEYPDARWVRLGWSDQEGIAHLWAQGVYNRDGRELDAYWETGYEGNLTDCNDGVWMAFIVDVPDNPGSFRLDIEAALTIEVIRKAQS